MSLKLFSIKGVGIQIVYFSLFFKFQLIAKMAYASSHAGQGSYINPNDLLPDEVQYELEIRNINMSRAPMEDQRGELRKVQLDELRNPRVITTQRTIEDELSVVQVKLIMLRQELEVQGGRQALISRLRHIRVRVNRLNAYDERQVKMKEEVLDEIEFLLDTFGNPEDRARTINLSNSQRTMLHRNTGAIPRNPLYEFPLPSNEQRPLELGTTTTANLRDNATGISRDATSTLKRPRVGFLPNSTQATNKTLNPFLNQSIRSDDSFRPLFQATCTQTLPSTTLPPPQIEGSQSPPTHRTPPSLPPPSTGNQPPPRQAPHEAPEEEQSPATPTIGDNTRLRAEVSRIVEDVLSNQLENLMIRISQGMQEFQRRAVPMPDVGAGERNVTRGQEQHPTVNYEQSGRPGWASDGRQFQPTQTIEPMSNRTNNRTSTPIQPINRREQPTHYSRAENRVDHRPVDQFNSENRNFQNQHKIPINKWPIKFSGEPRGMSAEEFLKRVDVLARNNQISEEELLSKANFLFRPESPAEIWYYTFSNKFNSWQALKHYLRLRFEVPNKDKVIEREIRDRKQMPNETFVTFMGEIERLCQQLSRPLSERSKRNIMIDNMRDWYRPHLAFIDTDTLDVETLCNLCHELDKSVYRSYASRGRPYNVHCIENQECTEEDEAAEINAITRNRQRTSRNPEERGENIAEATNTQQNTVLCWNCRQFGHFWRNCSKSKRLFCHICGQPEVVVMNCPSNHRYSQPEAKNERMEGNQGAALPH